MKLDPKIGRSLKKASPTILTCIGAAGVVATAVLAVKATPKADSLIKADSVLQAEYHINRNMVLGAFVTLNDFYDFLGISHVEGGDIVGWLLSDSMYWIDFDNSKAMVDDGLNGEIPCYVVDAEFDPQPESAWDY